MVAPTMSCEESHICTYAVFAWPCRTDDTDIGRRLENRFENSTPSRVCHCLLFSLFESSVINFVMELIEIGTEGPI